MEAIRRSKIKTHNHKIEVDLPKHFNAQEVELIIWPSENSSDQQSEIDIEKWRKDIRDFYSNYNIDLSNFKFNRDELYDRP
jgi:hypothetical protein